MNVSMVSLKIVSTGKCRKMYEWWKHIQSVLKPKNVDLGAMYTDREVQGL